MSEKSKDESKPSSLRQRVVDAAVKLASTARGAKALAEWVGEGGLPVEVSVAGERAQTCVKCPYNIDKPGILGAVALASIQEYEMARNNLRLSLPEDEQLHTCGICSCPLKLKVWVPIKHIAPSMEEFKFPDFCWIPKELTPPAPPAPPPVVVSKGEVTRQAPPLPTVVISRGQVVRIR